MIFSQEQKQAIAKLMKLMIIADGNVDANEVVSSAAIFSKLGISPNDISNADHLAEQEALRIISDMQSNEKRTVVAILGSIMIADGKIDDKEQVLINLITILCQLPIMSVGDAITELKKL